MPSLEIHQIDVGQGDASLILVRGDPPVGSAPGTKGSIEKTILVDAGRTGKEVHAYLEAMRLSGDFRPIDIFVASHYDSDHIGGAPLVLGDPNLVQKEYTAYDLGEPLSPDTDYTNYKDAIPAARRETAEIKNILSHGGVNVDIVAYNGVVAGSKNGTYYSVESGEDFDKRILTGGMSKFEAMNNPSGDTFVTSNKNGTSIGLLTTFKKFSHFTAGDLEGEFENEASIRVRDQLKKGGDGHVCTCKSGHHGSTESSSAEVLRNLRPRVSLVSAGTDNSFGHPTQTTVDRLESLAKKYPADYFVTGDTSAPMFGEKFPPGKLGKNGHNRTGNLVVSVTEAQANNHQFTVTAQNGGPTDFTCGHRPYDPNLEMPVEKEKRARKYTQTKEEREEARKKRKEAEAKQEAADHERLKQKLRDEILKHVDAAHKGEIQTELTDEVLEAWTNRLEKRLRADEDPDQLVTKEGTAFRRATTDKDSQKAYIQAKGPSNVSSNHTLVVGRGSGGKGSTVGRGSVANISRGGGTPMGRGR